ncbi:MAG: twin-arginine translocation signal domain-containing protein, partial [Pseudomonadota bacterium]|nr:twin-arginine translocation signal domain-containing protein [Pseudomonadota bacterium]
MNRPEHPVVYSRRQFLKAGGAAGGGLLVALQLPLVGCTGEEQQPTAELEGGDKPAPEQFRPNAFVRIAPSGDVILTVHKSEMGQGVHT